MKETVQKIKTFVHENRNALAYATAVGTAFGAGLLLGVQMGGWCGASGMYYYIKDVGLEAAQAIMEGAK